MKDNKFNICVYCASSNNIRDIFVDDAYLLGKEIASRKFNLITGAGKAGLMRAVNDGCIDLGGHTIGVIPEFMVKNNWQYDKIAELIITSDMHERKSLMASKADAVIALPGGAGTFEELMEIITWRQLGLFKGQVILLNTSNYYDYLIKMIDNAIKEGFMTEQHRNIFHVASTPAEAVELAYTLPVDNNFTPKIN